LSRPNIGFFASAVAAAAAAVMGFGVGWRALALFGESGLADICAKGSRSTKNLSNLCGAETPSPPTSPSVAMSIGCAILDPLVALFRTNSPYQSHET